MLQALLGLVFGSQAAIGRVLGILALVVNAAVTRAGIGGLAARIAVGGGRALQSALPALFKRGWRQPPEWTQFSTHAPRVYGGRSITGGLLLLGDDQLQHAFGDPDSTSNLFDRWSEPSSRPALTSLFGELLLEESLTHRVPQGAAPGRGNTLPVVHMGDATNTSCLAEWRRFEQTLLAAKASGSIGPCRPFIMLPGNHDGFLYGNFAARHRAWLDGPGALRKLLRAATFSQWQEWACRCAEPLGPGLPAGPMRKSDFVEKYLDLLASLYGPSVATTDDLQSVFDGPPDPSADWVLYRPPSIGKPFLLAALARIDRQRPNDSFLIQVIRWPAPPTATRRRWQESEADPQRHASPPPVFGLVLDTCDYPVRFMAAGTSGGIGGQQARLAGRLLRQQIGPDPASPALVSFLGHHNLEAVFFLGRWRFARLLRQLQTDARIRVLPLFVSAHRHRGGWLMSRLSSLPLGLREFLCLDLNVSSLVDWPLATREVSLAANPRHWARHHIVVSSRQQALNPEDGIGPAQAELSRRVALLDVLGQRRNRARRPVIERLCSVIKDPDRDARVAECALMEAAAATLGRLMRQPLFWASLPDGEQAAAGSAQAALAAARQASASAAGAVTQPQFETLRAALHEATRLVRAAAGGPLSPNPFRALLRAAIVEAAREDHARQWMANPWIIPAVGDRWYRRAGNLAERWALLRVLR